MFYQMNSFMLANELIQYFRNTSIATAVRLICNPLYLTHMLYSYLQDRIKTLPYKCFFLFYLEPISLNDKIIS